METVRRFRGLLIASKYCTVKQIRSLNLKYCNLGSSRDLKKPRGLAEFPDSTKLWTMFSGMKIMENRFKKFLLDELISECQVNTSLHYIEKILIIRSSFDSLMKRNVVPNISTVVNNLLSNLEPFPFDSTKLESNESEVSIKQIRNAIEKQYLVWRYKVDLDQMEEILHRYRFCLYEFRSLGNLKRNIDMLEKLPRTATLCVAEKIYHLNQKPFNVSFVGKFQETIAGLNWHLFPQQCPKILQHSHQYILFVISVLRDMKFREKQIQEGLPFLHLSFEHFIRRLSFMLTHSEIAKHRDEDKFLHLLSYQSHILKDLVNLRRASFIELTELITISSKNLTPSVRLITPKSIMYFVNQFYEVSSQSGKIVKKHPKYRLVSENQIHDTLTFLKTQNFKDKEIEESLTIVLYPRNLVERTLNKIKSEAKTLQKYGFKNGYVPQETTDFKYGTTERQKILQLCLYYLEKPYHFSGDGIWDCKVDNELDIVRCQGKCI